MTTYQKMKARIARHAPNVKTLKRVDYRYSVCNGRVVAQFKIDDHDITLEFVANRRVVIDYTERKAWAF